MKLKPVLFSIVLLSMPAWARAAQPGTAPAGLPDPKAVEVYPDPVIRLLHLGKYDEAEKLGKETIKSLSAKPAEKIPERAHAMANLAEVYIMTAHYKEAGELLATAEKLLDKDDEPTRLAKADVYSAQGTLASETGENEEAVVLATRALAIRRTALGLEDPLVADSMDDLVVANLQLDKTENAGGLLLRALRIRTAKFGADSLPVADSLSAQAFYYQNFGENPERARVACQKSLDIRKNLLGEKHVDVADSLYNMAQIDMAADKVDAARQELEEARTIISAALGKDHPYLAFMDQALSRCYAKAGDDKKALSLLEEASAITKKVFGDGHAYYADALELQSAQLRIMNDTQKADALDKQVADIRSKFKKKMDL